MTHVSTHTLIGSGLAAALAVILFAQSAATAPTDLVFIASSEAAVHSLSVEDIQNIYLGKKRAVNGVPVYAVDHSGTEPIKLDFLGRVLHMTHAQYRAHLLKRRFQEGAVTPTFAANAEQVLTAVRETPGTIGYVYESDVGTMLGLKVVATIPTQ